LSVPVYRLRLRNVFRAEIRIVQAESNSLAIVNCGMTANNLFDILRVNIFTGVVSFNNPQDTSLFDLTRNVVKAQNVSVCCRPSRRSNN